MVVDVTAARGTVPGAHWRPEDCDPADLVALLNRDTVPDDAPGATTIESGVPIYDGARLRPWLDDPAGRRALLSEWAHVLGEGAGVLVLRGAYGDTAPVDRATAAFEAIIAEESEGGGGSDHFAAAGSNARVWCSAGKLCERDPEGFARYHGNPLIAAACEAWLGPAYQVTAQVNLVRPGGAGQTAHRDYHLGFQGAEAAARWPRHAHALSAALTLQGAIAHCDMPVESGPTRLLPRSQLYGPGYLAQHDERFGALFEERAVQVPLGKGDALFFNPALLHAAGANRSADVQRMANLLQVSSAFGRAMEAMDRRGMAMRLYPALLSLTAEGAEGRLGAAEAEAAIAACAESYPFPTNLDTDPPVGGNAPGSEADLMRRALAERWEPDEFEAALIERAAARVP